MKTDTPAPLAARVIAVTGASRGIGHAVCRRLAAAGATVLAGARTRPVFDGDAGRIIGAALDVGSEAEVAAFAAQAQALGVDALVHNAGIGRFAPLEELSVADCRAVLDTNVLGTLLLARAFIPEFKRRHARGLGSQWVMVTSDVSARTFSGGGVYTASKHAQRALSQTLAREGAAYGLRVTELRTGMVDTHFNQATPGQPERAGYLRAEDVADAVLQALTAPPHLRIDEILLHPTMQAVDF